MESYFFIILYLYFLLFLYAIKETKRKYQRKERKHAQFSSSSLCSAEFLFFGYAESLCLANLRFALQTMLVLLLLRALRSEQLLFVRQRQNECCLRCIAPSSLVHVEHYKYLANEAIAREVFCATFLPAQKSGNRIKKRPNPHPRLNNSQSSLRVSTLPVGEGYVLYNITFCIKCYLPRLLAKQICLS